MEVISKSSIVIEDLEPTKDYHKGHNPADGFQ